MMFIILLEELSEQIFWSKDVETLCCESLPFYAYLSTSPAASSPKIEPASHPAILPFSSGTTGPPKGVMVSHKNLITQTLSHVGDGEYYYRAFANFQDTTLVGNLTKGKTES